MGAVWSRGPPQTETKPAGGRNTGAYRALRVRRVPAGAHLIFASKPSPRPLSVVNGFLSGFEPEGALGGTPLLECFAPKWGVQPREGCGIVRESFQGEFPASWWGPWSVSASTRTGSPTSWLWPFRAAGATSHFFEARIVRRDALSREQIDLSIFLG